MASLPEHPARCAIYVRVSSAGQEDNSSLPTQEAACRAYAEDHGYAVGEAHVYRDVHSGAELWDRPALTRLREAMRRREIDVLVCYAIDRLSREQHHLGLIVSEADHAKVRLEFVTEVLDATPAGKLIFAARAFAGEVELEKIRERMNRGKFNRVMEKRKMPQGKALFGYQWNADKTAYVIDPITAPVVQKMFAAAANGRTLRAIRDTLMAEHVTAPRGGDRWNHSMVRRILGHPHYTGEAVVWRGKLIDRKTHKRVLRDESEHIGLPEGTIPPIVDAATFAAVQERLARNKAEAIRNAKHPEASLLRGGYVRCGACGRTMRANHVKNRVRYVCVGRAQQLCTAPVTIAGGVLDADVWRRLSAAIQDPELIEAQIRDLAADDPTEADIATVDREITQVTRQQGNLARRIAMMDDDDVAAPLVAELKKLTERHTKLKAERDTVLSRRQQWETAQANLRDVRDWCGAVAQRVANADYEHKRLALAAFNVQVTVYGASHEPPYIITADPDIPLVAAPTNGTGHKESHITVHLRWTADDPLVFRWHP